MTTGLMVVQIETVVMEEILIVKRNEATQYGRLYESEIRLLYNYY
jgi:hypothetical protein